MENWTGKRVKVGPKGNKRWGTVTRHDIHVDPIEVSLGGLFPGGPLADDHRKFVPGLATETITIELEPPS